MSDRSSESSELKKSPSYDEITIRIPEVVDGVVKDLEGTPVKFMEEELELTGSSSDEEDLFSSGSLSMEEKESEEPVDHDHLRPHRPRRRKVKMEVFHKKKKKKKKHQRGKAQLTFEHLKPTLEAIWRKVDENNDNELDLQELRKVFLEIGEDISDEEIKCMMREVDFDGSNTISKSEFFELMKQRFHTPVEDEVVSWFSWFDPDGKGEIKISKFIIFLNNFGQILSGYDKSLFIKRIKEFSKNGRSFNYSEFVKEYVHIANDSD